MFACDYVHQGNIILVLFILLRRVSQANPFNDHYPLTCSAAAANIYFSVPAFVVLFRESLEVGFSLIETNESGAKPHSGDNDVSLC